MSDPLYHRCGTADLSYVCQPVELRELMMELGDGSMRHLTVHRTVICHACGRNWYLLEFDQLGAEPDTDLGLPVERQRRLVCAPKPQVLIDALEAAALRAKYKRSKKSAA